MQDFRKLKVWEKSHQLALRVYTATASLPKSEVYGLTSQMRRAGASIPSNIAEGCGRDGNAELARFLHYAMGSASELEYHVILARDLKMLECKESTDLEDQVTEVKRMLASLIRRLRADN